MYEEYGGVVLDRQEGIRIAKALGNGKAVILQNHGLLTVGRSVDEAAFWFISLDKTCQVQLLADAASAGNGYKKRIIGDEEAAFTYEQAGGEFLGYEMKIWLSGADVFAGPEKGWLAFQGYYDEQLAKTNGHFLK